MTVPPERVQILDVLGVKDKTQKRQKSKNKIKFAKTRQVHSIAIIYSK